MNDKLSNSELKSESDLNEITRIAILTQEDSFVIPENINILSKVKNIEVVCVIKIDSPGSLSNKKSLFIKGFGILQVAKMGTLFSFNKLLNLIDSIFLFKLKFLKSLRSAAVNSHSEYIEIRDPNDQSNIDWLAKKKIDLIISFSAPCVFKKELLEVPILGCINLHCSLLPNYAGLLPSFWTLFYKEQNLGATVHRMDDKIDNGSILGQVEIPKLSNPSMFEVIKKTKIAGGKLMISVVKDMIRGKILEQTNNVDSESYHSWPSLEQIKLFRANGGKLI